MPLYNFKADQHGLGLLRFLDKGGTEAYSRDLDFKWAEEGLAKRLPGDVGWNCQEGNVNAASVLGWSSPRERTSKHRDASESGRRKSDFFLKSILVSWFQKGSVKWVFKGEIMKKWDGSIYSPASYGWRRWQKDPVTISDVGFYTKDASGLTAGLDSVLVMCLLCWCRTPSLIQLHLSVM